MEQPLINDLIVRLAVELQIPLPPTYRSKDPGAASASSDTRAGGGLGVIEERRKLLEASLIELSSKGKVNMVAYTLNEVLEFLAKMSISSEEMQGRVSSSQLYLLDLLRRCLLAPWQAARDALRQSPPAASSGSSASPSASPSEGDENEALRARDQLEQTMPPPLEESLAANLAAELLATLVTRLHPLLDAELRKKAGLALFQLSASNYAPVFARLNALVAAGAEREKDDEQPAVRALQALEHLALNKQRLAELLEALLRHAAAFRKPALLGMAQALRRAIWSWIDNCPSEFIQLNASGGRLPGAPDQLFDLLEAAAVKHKLKTDFWPVQTMLLLLCPDIIIALNQTALGTASSSSSSKSPAQQAQLAKDAAAKGKFLDALKKGLSAPKLADVSIACLVDLCRASTFTARRDQNERGLRGMVPSLENELKERLFDPRRLEPAASSKDPAADVRLLTDALVAFYRLSHRKVISSLFLGCLDGFDKQPAPPQHKLALIKALLTIAKERAALPWFPGLQDCYPALSAKLRAAFLELVATIGAAHDASMAARLRGEAAKSAGKGVVTLERVNTEMELLGKLLTLFLTDPLLPLHPGRDAAHDLDETRRLLSGLVSCARMFLLPGLADQAAGVLVHLYAREHILLWCRKDQLMGFWEISGDVQAALAAVLINQKDLSVTQAAKVIRLLYSLLESRNAFLSYAREHRSTELAQLLHAGSHEALLKSSPSTKLEIALLIHLCSPEPDVCALCCDCFGLLCDELQILASASGGPPAASTSSGPSSSSPLGGASAVAASRPDGATSATGPASDPLSPPLATPLTASNSILANYRVYRRLANTRGRITGRVAQQKTIRNLLRRMEHQTLGNNLAWEEVYARWRDYTPVIRQLETEAADKAAAVAAGASSGSMPKRKVPLALPLAERPLAELSIEWQHYTGFLLALAGVCIRSGRAVQVGGRGGGAAPAPSPNNNHEEFLRELMELIQDPVVNVREPVKMLLGQALAPAAYSVGFRLMHEILRTSFGAAGQVQVKSNATLFVDQVIQIVKMVLELPLESADELALLANFEPLLLDLLRYVSQLLPSIATLVIKRKLCELVETVMAQRAAIPFRAEIKFRNALLDAIIEWISDFAQPSSSASPAAAASPASLGPGTVSNARLGAGGGTPAEAAAASEVAAARELQRLQRDIDVNCMRAVAALLRRLPLGEAGARSEEKNKRFAKHFNFLSNLLTRCKRDPEVRAELPELVIQALSAIMAANMDCGLEHFVTMGYHEDLDTRAAFLTVLANILNQGAEFDATDADPADRYERLLELLVAGDAQLSLAAALCEAAPITEADELAAVLVRLFEAHAPGHAAALLKTLMRLEVARTDSANTLFRRNSMATKVQAAFGKLAGAAYLRDTLAPPLERLVAQPTLTYELDPAKLLPGESLAQNLENVRAATALYLAAIRERLPACPAPLRDACAFLYDVVRAKYPDHALMAVGGFVFLRFFCPATLAPEGFGVCSSLPAGPLRRGLVLVTKCLQSLVNGQLPREPWAEGLHPFVQANMTVMNQLLEQFVRVPAQAPPAPPLAHTYTDEQRQEDLVRVHLFLQTNLERVTKQLAADSSAAATRAASPPPANDKRGTAAGNALQRLTALLAVLGPAPSDRPQGKAAGTPQRTAPAGGASEYEQFMRANQDKSTDAIKEANVFYQAGQTREKHPVFYLIARNAFPPPDMDGDLLLLYVLRTTQAAWSKPFVLVVDLCQFGPENRQPPKQLQRLLKIFPEAAGQNLSQVLLVAPNHAFKKYAKSPAGRLLAARYKRFQFVATPAILSSYIAEADVALPAQSAAVDKDVKATFDRVFKVGQHMQQKEVVLRVATDQLQVLSCKQYHLLGAKTTPLLDLYHVSQIDELSLNSDLELVLKLDFKYVTYRCAAADQLLQALKASKARWQLVAAQRPAARTSFRPADVPGTLLNMALQNLGAPQKGALRAAAYALLDALCGNFRFSVRAALLDTPALSVPRNSAQFVSRISARLALTEPTLTLEFLKECLLSFQKTTPASKLLTLEYMTPWLPNLALFVHGSPAPDAAEKLFKTGEVLTLLIELTLRETALQPAVLAHSWATLARVPALTETLLDALLARALGEDSMFGPVGDVLCDVAVALAAQTPQPVAGKLIARLLRLLASTGMQHQPQRESLDEHEAWKEVVVLLRMLQQLAFENLVALPHFLPELFHIIVLTFNTGPLPVRTCVHGMCINVVHALYTSGNGSAIAPADNKLESLRFLLGELSGPRFKLHYGIAGASEHGAGGKRARMPIQTVDPVANALVMVLNYCSPLNNAVGTPAHSRWLALTAATAFSPNLALQPRALAALGVLHIRDARGGTLVSDDLVSELLLRLRDALSTPSALGHDLPVSIILCLSRLYEAIPSHSRYFTALFWLGMTLAQLPDVRLFAAALQLLEVILRTLDYTEGVLADQELSAFLMGVREGALDLLLAKLDLITGVSFRTSFAFAVAAHLLKGLRESSTKTATARLLSLFLDLSAKKHVGPHILGYLAALLPGRGLDDDARLHELLDEAPSRTPQCFFVDQLALDTPHAALLFTLLVALLQRNTPEHEQLFIYEALKEGVARMPDAFTVTLDSLIPKMAEVIEKSQNSAVVSAALQIMSAVFAPQTAPHSKLTRQYLDTLHFGGLPSVISHDDTFKNLPLVLKRDQLVAAAVTIIDCLVTSTTADVRPFSTALPTAAVAP